MRRHARVVMCFLVATGVAFTVWPLGAGSGQQQPPLPGAKASVEQRAAEVQQVQELAPPLLEMLDLTRDFQQELSLKEVAILLYEKLSADGKDLPIIIDADAFKEEHPKAPDINDTHVMFPPVPRKMTLGEALRTAIAKVPHHNGTFVVKKHAIEITTFEKASIKRQLAEAISGHYQGMRVSEVLRDLAAQMGCTILIDKRADTEANRSVSVTFRGDASLGAAVRAVADMVRLKAVVLDGMLYVTTPEHAAKLRKETQAIIDGEDPLWPDLRRLPRSKSMAASNENEPAGINSAAR
jgi:hypothetical protein